MGRRKKEVTETINEQPTGFVEGSMPEPVSCLPTAPDPKPTPKEKAVDYDVPYELPFPKEEKAADPDTVTKDPKAADKKPVRTKTFGIYFEKSEYKGHSLTEALRLAGIDSSFINRKKIAEANGIDNYLGLGKDNKEMLELFIAGELKRPE